MTRSPERRRLRRTVRLCIVGFVYGAGGGATAVACSPSETKPAADASASPDASTAVDGALPPEGGSDVGGGDAGGGDDGGEAGDGGGAPVADAGTVSITRGGGVPNSPFAFGQNYWDWVDWAGDGVTGVTGTEARVTALGLNVIRAGGANNDMNGPPPAVFNTSKIDAFVSYCRAVGAEPILQVPVIANYADGGAATAQTAADMVTYANVTKGYGIKYWEIGNEPDLYSRTYDAGVPAAPADFCTLYQGYVTAMKTANAAAPDGGASMAFLGPELAFEYIQGADFLTPFLDGCKAYVDIVSVHRYPFSGVQTSVTGALADVTSFRRAVASLNAIVQGHARPGTPLAITEANISYDYLASVYTPTSLLAAPTTFYAGLWAVDILGAALENNLWTLAFWDIGDPHTAPSVLGFLQDGQPVPSYYTTQMVSTTFRGSIVVPAGVPVGFSAYASYDPSRGMTAVLVLNKTALASGLTIAVDSLPSQSFAFPALSATLLQIPDSPAGATHVVQYTQDQSNVGAGPVTIQ
jgi:hypothetical protein